MGEFLVSNERTVCYALFNETGDVVNVTLTGRDDENRPVYFYSAHINGAVAYKSHDLCGGSGTAGDAREGFRSLVSYIGAEAERYSGSGKMGQAVPDDGWIFDGGRVSEWCYANAEDIAADVMEPESDGTDSTHYEPNGGCKVCGIHAAYHIKPCESKPES